MTNQRNTDPSCRAADAARPPSWPQRTAGRADTSCWQLLQPGDVSRTFVARGHWSEGTWTLGEVEGSSVAVDDVRTSSLAGLPEAVRTRLAVHERLPVESIEVLVCAGSDDVAAWLIARRDAVPTLDEQPADA